MSENASDTTRGPRPGEDTDVVDAFEAAVGDISGPDGRTTVRLERKGQFLVVHEWIEEREPGPAEQQDKEQQEQQEPKRERGEQREESRGDVRELGVEPERLFVLIESVPVHDDFPRRPGLPDEPILTLTVESAAGARSQRMWLRDVERELDELIAPLRTVVERATDGRRYL